MHLRAGERSRREPLVRKVRWCPFGLCLHCRHKLANVKHPLLRTAVNDNADFGHRSAQAARLRTDPADYNVSVTDAQRERGSVVFTAWVATVLLVVIPPLWVARGRTPTRGRPVHRARPRARRVVAWC